MAKTIGFIDYYIDEWHANNYPQMIRDAKLGDRFEVTLAWEQLTPEGKTPLADWCKQQGVAQASSIEQVVDECDVIVVLSPDNGEMHESLSDLPLKSGKPVYVDKPIALKYDEAMRMFDKAAAHGTPMMSSSALRFDTTLTDALAGPLANGGVQFARTTGPGLFHIYAVHQLEMLTALMGPGAKRIMQTIDGAVGQLVIDWGDRRNAAMTIMDGLPFTFSAYAPSEGESQATVYVDTMADFFPRFIDAMLEFFDTGESKVDPAQTLTIAGLIEAGVEAMGRPQEWVVVPGA